MIREILTTTTLVTILSMPVVGKTAVESPLSTVTTAAVQEAEFDLYKESYQVDMPLKVPFLKILGIPIIKVNLTLKGEIGQGSIDLDIYHKDNLVGTAEGTFDCVDGVDVTVTAKKKRPLTIAGTFDGRVATGTSWYLEGKRKETSYAAEILKTELNQGGINVTFAYVGADKVRHQRTAFVTPISSTRDYAR